jgi:hypothetical protein
LLAGVRPVDADATDLPPSDGIGKGVCVMRRTAGLLVIAAAALVGLVASTVPGTAAAPSVTAAPARVHLGAVLVGGNEVPGPGDTDAYGLANVRVESGEVCWRITVSETVAPITAAHIHAGPAGVAGPVAVPLEPYNRGCTDASHRLTRFIKNHPSHFYVNVHNDEFAAGALRGQLLK